MFCMRLVPNYRRYASSLHNEINKRPQTKHHLSRFSCPTENHPGSSLATEAAPGSTAYRGPPSPTEKVRHDLFKPEDSPRRQAIPLSAFGSKMVVLSLGPTCHSPAALFRQFIT